MTIAQTEPSSTLLRRPLVFLHLSDIHFRWPKHGVQYELDDDLRNEIQRDAKLMHDQLGAPSAILITGDVAFSASPDEYKIATDWILGELSTVTGCPGEDICCIPGNHDVDWNVIRKSKPIRDCHDSLRGQELHLIDGAIGEYLSDSFVFYRALDNYNTFAVQFDCDLSVERPFWNRDFALNDGSTLRVRGANSTLVSDESDGVRNGRLLVLGAHQCTMKNEDGVEHLFLSHHPPQWLLDAGAVEKLIRRACIQMFGHKHEQKLTEIDHRLRVAAGAVHPDRKERNWKPRYNWMCVEAKGTADDRTFEVAVHPRVWSDQETKFVPDFDECQGSESKRYTLPVDSWTPPVTAELSVTTASSSQLAPMANGGENVTAQRRPMDPARTLAHRFLSLPYLMRMEVAQTLKLLRDGDGSLQETERSKRVFIRAKENRLLAQLWNEVERRHNDGKYSTNPFQK